MCLSWLYDFLFLFFLVFLPSKIEKSNNRREEWWKLILFDVIDILHGMLLEFGWVERLTKMGLLTGLFPFLQNLLDDFNLVMKPSFTVFFWILNLWTFFVFAPFQCWECRILGFLWLKGIDWGFGASFLHVLYPLSSNMIALVSLTTTFLIFIHWYGGVLVVELVTLPNLWKLSSLE